MRSGLIYYDSNASYPGAWGYNWSNKAFYEESDSYAFSFILTGNGDYPNNKDSRINGRPLRCLVR